MNYIKEFNKSQRGGLFVASLLALTSFGSYNRCISDFANALSKFLAPLGTSDMPKPLGDISGLKTGGDKICPR